MVWDANGALFRGPKVYEFCEYYSNLTNAENVPFPTLPVMLSLLVCGSRQKAASARPILAHRAPVTCM